MSADESLRLDDGQRGAWSSAQALWGVTLHDARPHPHAEKGTFAWFSFPPQVWFDLDDPTASGVEACLESIFAHEIGHHVLSPSTRQDDFKIRHQMARALSATGVHTRQLPERAAWFANVWSDMLINVRVAQLQRLRDAGSEAGDRDPEMIEMWRILSTASTPGRLWWVVLRAYEILWSKPPGTLCETDPPIVTLPDPETDAEDPAQAFDRDDPALAVRLARLVDAQEQRRALQTQLDSLARTDPELDATLLAETVRTFGADPISGALRFGMILAPYILEAQREYGRDDAVESARGCGGQLGARPATPGELVAVLADARLRETPEHPATAGGGPAGSVTGNAVGQGYGTASTLALYEASDPSAVLSAWYQSRARPWVSPLVQPASEPVISDDAIPGALEEWSLGDDFADIDWPATLAAGPVVVPGVTTKRRDLLPDAPSPERESVQLDLYIDSSGSMRSPANDSPAVLAGTILLLSTLQGGGRIRVTSFSAAGQVAGMEQFTRDRTEAFRYLTTYFGSGTTFPLDLLADRYRSSPARREVRRHLVVLSDDGLLSLFGAGQEHGDRVAVDVRRRVDTATLLVEDPGRRVAVPAAAAGYDVLYVDSMADAPAACAALAMRLATAIPEAARG